MKSIQVSVKCTSSGFTVKLNQKTIHTSYPVKVWRVFPKYHQQILADSAAYFFTQHMALWKNKIINYHFPPPPAQSLFFHGFLFSLPELVIEFPEGKFTTSQLIKRTYNSSFNWHFSGHAYAKTETHSFLPNGKKAVMAFSFGKDSLLSFALAKELNLDIFPYYFAEPESHYENKNKARLKSKFEDEFNQKINVINVGLGNLRQNRGFMWGWDMLLTQYTLLLIPYVHYHQAGYFFWSNEKSVDEREIDNEDFIINPTFEQGLEWGLNLNNLLRIFSANTQLGSLIGSIHELLVLYVLHHRYAKIGKYQLSCFNDEITSKSQRWCGRCYECARVYIFLVAVGVDPRSVGFTDNMLHKSKRDLFYIFPKKNRTNKQLDILFQSYGERLLAFYIAYKRGVKGDLIDLFASTLLDTVQKNKKNLFAKYFRLYPNKTIPQALASPVEAILKTELTRLKNELKPYF